MDQLESNITELELEISHSLDHSDMEEALDNPPPMEMDWVERQEQQDQEKKMEEQLQKEKGDSTFIQDIGLDEEQEMELDLNCSFQDSDYQEPRDAHISSSSSEDECKLEESFMSGKGRGMKKMKGTLAIGLRS